ncbi:hypothetical protein D3C84_479420 [compost metagenome]
MQAVQVLVVHALARNDGHGLRDVFDLDIALADADFIAGVRVRAFGGRPLLQTGDRSGAELQRAGIVRRRYQ